MRIEDTIREIVGREIGLPPDAVPLDTSVRELPEIESIKLLRAVTRIEARFGCELDDEVVFRVVTLRELADVVRAATAPAPRATVTIGPWRRPA